MKLEDSWASLVLELVDASLLLYRHHFLVWNFTIGAEITRLMVCTLRIFFPLLIPLRKDVKTRVETKFRSKEYSKDQIIKTVIVKRDREISMGENI